MKLFLSSEGAIIVIILLGLLFFGGSLLLFMLREADVMSELYGNDASWTARGRCGDMNLPYRDPSLAPEKRAKDLLSRMTLEEKIGQMALVERSSLGDSANIGKYHLGALFSGGGSNPSDNTPEGWRRMTAEYEAYSGESCLGIPILYAVDAVHGFGNLPSATVFPHAIGFGAANDVRLVEEAAAATAEEAAAIGVNWNFFPSLDVVKDVRWGRTYETFGSDPQRVAALGAAYVRGFQGSKHAGVNSMATVKHFVGAGAAAWGSSSNPDFGIDQGNIDIKEEELRAEQLLPFSAAIDAGVGSVMAGLGSWQGQKLAGSRYLLTDVLRGEMNFVGFTVSDWYGASGLAEDECESWKMAVNAGVDMVMVPSGYVQFVSCMKAAAKDGAVSSSRINEAVFRILLAKFAMGLFDKSREAADDFSAIGSSEHRELAREAVRKSLVLLEDKNGALPLEKDAPLILVGGSAADNLGRQSGGWTVEWQGGEGKTIEGISILEGIRKAVSFATRVEFSEKGDFSLPAEGKAQIGIAAVGERPYAEGQGDDVDPRLSPEDIETIRKMREKCERLVVVIVSGRPLNIKEESRQWDAAVAAWLPGSEGEGISDILFGDYPFMGTLPVAWEM
jgi:beta-glucosidase